MKFRYSWVWGNKKLLHLHLVLIQNIKYNITLADLECLQNGLSIDENKEIQMANELKSSMNIKAPSIMQKVGNLSGGNQQKVLMAKWLAAGVDILILDEPTRGVDVNAKQVIHNVVKDYVSKGNSVILLSSDLPEVVGLADRAVILREGHTIGMIRKKDMTENSILIAANGEGEFVSCQK